MFKSWCIQVVFVHVNMCATVCVSKLFSCVRGHVILLIDFLLYICWQQLHLYHLYELYKSLSWSVLFIYSFWLTHFLVLAFPHTVGDIGNMQPEVHRDQDKLFEIQDGLLCTGVLHVLLLHRRLSEFPSNTHIPLMLASLDTPHTGTYMMYKNHYTSKLHLHVCSKMYKQNSERVHINPKT